MVASHSWGQCTITRLICTSALKLETDTAVSWHGCGSLRVATSDAHMDWIHHTRDVVLARGQEAHIVGPNEVASLNPLYDVKRAEVKGAIFTLMTAMWIHQARARPWRRVHVNWALKS